MYLNTFKHINSLSDLFQDNVEDSISNLWNSYNTSIAADESKNEYVFTCELPGYDKNDIAMSTKKGVLSIGADNKERGKKFKKEQYRRNSNRLKFKKEQQRNAAITCKQQVHNHKQQVHIHSFFERQRVSARKK